MQQSPSELAAQLFAEVTEVLHMEMCRWIIVHGGFKDPTLFCDVVREYRMLQAKSLTRDTSTEF